VIRYEGFFQAAAISLATKLLDFIRQDGVIQILKKLLFWNYPRNTWQWDALCVVILIFIFLTPKSWFGTGEPHPAISTLLMSTELIENEADQGQIQNRVRTMTGKSEAQVVGVRKRVGQDGRILGYEVDIR